MYFIFSSRYSLYFSSLNQQIRANSLLLSSIPGAPTNAIWKSVFQMTITLLHQSLLNFALCEADNRKKKSYADFLSARFHVNNVHGEPPELRLQQTVPHREIIRSHDLHGGRSARAHCVRDTAITISKSLIWSFNVRRLSVRSLLEWGF